MRHTLSIDKISLYIDKRLPDKRAESIRRHIDVCPGCQKMFGMLDRYKAALSNLPAVEESEYFDFEFRKRLNDAIAKKREGRGFEIVAREMLENIKNVLRPPVPVMARVVAMILLVFTIGTGAFYYTRVDTPLIVSIQGVANITDSRGIAWEEVTPGKRIGPNSIISTREGSFLDIEVTDKFAMRLKGDSKLRVASFTPRYRRGEVDLELINGKMLIRIEEGFKGSRFYIKTPSAEVKAIGTKFAIDVVERDNKTWVGVLEGSVEVKGRPKIPLYAEAKEVVVNAGQKTEVSIGEMPLKPERLARDEWRELEELYQIGKKLQVILLVRNTPNRVRELLRPAPLYISDEEPREIPELLEEAVYKISEALKTRDKTKHLDSIRILERIAAEHPNPRYDPQLLLFVGAYYNYIDYHEEAIEAFEKVVEGYPETTFASMAQCAIGIIYEEKLNDPERAKDAYNKVLRIYPDSLEAIWIESRKGNKVVRY